MYVCVNAFNYIYDEIKASDHDEVYVTHVYFTCVCVFVCVSVDTKHKWLSQWLCFMFKNIENFSYI